MKDNKEFINEIYKKYEDYQKEKFYNKQKENGKKRISKMRKIFNIAAVFVIVFTISFILNDANKFNVDQEEKYNLAKENIQSEEKPVISLATVGDFENFYNIAKNVNENQNNVMQETTIGDATDVQNESTNSTTENKNHSSTNTQVENVDEADIVKVDEKYIYYVSGDEEIVIVDIENQLNIISKIEFEDNEFNASEIFVNNKKLIVLGNTVEYNRDGSKTIYSTTDIDYVIGGSSNKVIAIIYDISNINEPKETRRIEIEGSYISSRMIGENIYFATNKYIYSSNVLKNDIENLDENDYKPKYKDTAVSNEEKYINYDQIYQFENIEEISYLNIIGFNINNNTEADIETFLGAGDKIYCSEKNMYIAKSKSMYDVGTGIELGYNTKIIKFSLDKGKIEFKAEADVVGFVNNQFSMDEDSNGNFRIATTVGNLWNIDENTSNSLYILNDKLEEVGKLDGIAKEEKIYSVRYVGDIAYIVTFKQTDPLFVIDLSNSASPTILGELKLPGYSTYLHPYDETHIIGFGYETKENGTVITTDGLKMVMFDVSDLSNPQVLFKVNIGDRYTNADLTYNHKALLYLKDMNIIAFSTDKYEKGSYISKALIYQIDLEKGFNLKGEIIQTGDYKDKIQRIVYSHDMFITLSDTFIKSFDITSLNKINEIELNK